MVKDDIVRYLEAYVASFSPPLLEGVAISTLRRNSAGPFELTSTQGTYTADQVVVATGGYHRPSVPRLAERLPDTIRQIHSSDYRNPASLPEGAVLVVGTGQSGCQIAEDLHREGRQVHLCVGSAPRSPRLYRGRDVVDWLTENGYYAIPAHEHPQRERLHEKTNHYLSGRDGGKDIDLRQFALEGMKLYGRLKDLNGRRLVFHPDLRHNLDQADASCEGIKASIDRYIAEKGIVAPLDPPFRPVWSPEREPLELDLEAAGISSIIWCIGFESDFRWVELPAFNGRGYPVHHRGVTTVPGLYFLGLPWLNTWGSGRFSAVGDDARHLLTHITSAQSLALQRPLLAA